MVPRYIFTITSLLCFQYCFGAPPPDSTLIIYFKTDQYKLSVKERQSIADLLSGFKVPVAVAVSGHTDKNGSFSYNKKLSARRSRQVSDYVKSMAPSAIIAPAENFGETRPASEEEYALNRRVEIIVRALITTKGETVENEVKETDPTIVKRLSFDNIYFIPDMAMVEYNSLAYLDQVGAMLRAYGTEKFEIRGHVNCPLALAKDTAYMKKMDVLSEARAKEVYEQLMRRGIAAERMTYLGMSNREMVFPHAVTLEEQRRNMRVEIIVRR